MIYKTVSEVNPSVMEMIRKVYGSEIIRFFDCPLIGASVTLKATPVIPCERNMTVIEAFKSAKRIRKLQIAKGRAV